MFLDRNTVNTFPGSIEARKTLVAASQTARIKEISVKTGQAIAVGDPLIQLIDAQLEDRLTGKRREIAALEAEVSRAKAVAEVELAWRRRELQAEIFETQLKVAALSQEKLNKQVEQIAWKDRLSSFGQDSIALLSDGDHPFRTVSAMSDDRRLHAMLREDAAASAAETLAAQIALCEQRLKSLTALDHSLDTKIRASSGVDVHEARLTGVKQELAALEGQSRELTMASPVRGTIGEVTLQAGDRVAGGGTLVEILDDRQTHVAARIPSSLATRVRQGAKVTLVFPQNEQRTGLVSAISPQAVSELGATESVLPVRIEPTGKTWPKLAIGSNVKIHLQ